MNEIEMSRDIEKDLMQMLAAEITQEIDREILNTMRDAIPRTSNPRHCYE